MIIKCSQCLAEKPSTDFAPNKAKLSGVQSACRECCNATARAKRARGKPRPWTLEERFWWKIDKTETCWNWTGYKKNGYGVIYAAGSRYAHRLSWEWQHGPIPDNMCVLHHCDNRKCVRPDHLFLGTKQDNNADCASKGRNVAQKRPEIRRGERNSTARLTTAMVLEIRSKHAAGVAMRQLSQEYGMDYTTICKVISRTLWAHV